MSECVSFSEMIFYKAYDSPQSVQLSKNRKMKGSYQVTTFIFKFLHRNDFYFYTSYQAPNMGPKFWSKKPKRPCTEMCRARVFSLE